MANEKDQIVDQKEELVEVQETPETTEVVTEDAPDASGDQPMEPVEGYVDDFPVSEEALGDLDDKYLREDPMVVGYKSLEEMEIVYDFVASNFDATQESILDIGCGRGDFLTHVQTLYQSDVKYHGIDMNKVLIGVAKEMNPNANFTATNLFKLDGNYASDCANAQDVFDEQYLAYDPVEVLDWALNEYGQLGGNVRLDHSIADSLFTLTIYK